ncbi:hypothetical protein [Paenibacillus donghaensis]|uniref:Uncharacterized protein n=1 Tax=Paenibacillus donghaensis TaxID=414771 RepID=A0A2Z2KE92_9BACL|nr:hypothetical protein [Paenibacillus donghaensis]ASA24374.1 hypothetical protein B9T62_28660 [Paenibacillus donghaensis]
MAKFSGELIDLSMDTNATVEQRVVSSNEANRLSNGLLIRVLIRTIEEIGSTTAQTAVSAEFFSSATVNLLPYIEEDNNL